MPPAESVSVRESLVDPSRSLVSAVSVRKRHLSRSFVKFICPYHVLAHTLVRNIALLSIDALRADHLSGYGYDRDTSPFLDSLADDGFRYEWAFSASSHTREAVPAILTGRAPQNAIAPDFTLDADTVATFLADTHATAAFHSNPYVSRAYGFGRDFDAFDDDMYLGRNRILALAQRAFEKFVFSRGEYHARAEEINDRSLTWLDSLSEDEPFFLWNHYMDPHGPYNPPDGSPYTDTTVGNAESQALYHRINDAEGSQADHDLAVDLYDGEIRYLDDCIRSLFDALAERDLLDETLVVVTADHGDLFGEHGRYGHPRYVYPELTRVPLLVVGSNIGSATRSDPVSTVDVLPTLLDAVGHDRVDLPGRSLLRPSDLGDPVFSSATAQDEHEGLRRFAAWDGPRGYLLTREIDGGDVTAESALSVPTGESVALDTLDTEERERFDRLRKELLSHSRGQLRSVDKTDDDVDRQVEDRLEALGYK